MIRSFLYSVFLHSILFLFTVSNYMVSNKIIHDYVYLLESEIENNILNVVDIKHSKTDSYPQISLDEKINLYQLAKTYSKNKKSSQIPIEKLTGIYVNSGETNQKFKLNSNESGKKDLPINQDFDKNDVIFLGPSDYKKLLTKSENIKDDIVTNYNDNTKIEKNIINGTVKIDMDKIFTNEDIEKIKEKFNENYDNMALSKREKFSIQNQILICYKNALIQTKKASKLKVFVTIEMKKNGYINMKTVKIDIPSNPDKKEQDIAHKNIMTSLDYCNPLRNLPAMKYDAWKVINLVFNGI